MSKRIEIILSWACNNNCIFCSEDELKKIAIKKNKFTRSYEELKKDIENYANKGYNHITFLGGEPTIHKDIIKIINFTKTKGFKTIFITTNGRMLSNKNFANKIISAGLNEVCISIHGTYEIHNKMTRSSNSYNQAIQALNNLNGKIKLMTNSVITKENMNNLPSLMKILNEYKLERCAVAYPLLRGNMLNNEIPTYSDVYPHLKEIIKASRHKIKISNVPSCMLRDIENNSDDIEYDERDYKSALNDSGKRFEDGIDEIKIKKCEICKFNNYCRGIPREYIEKFTDREFN